MKKRTDIDLNLMQRQWENGELTELEIARYHNIGTSTLRRRAENWVRKNDCRQHDPKSRTKALKLLLKFNFTEVERMTNISRTTLYKWWNEK